MHRTVIAVNNSDVEVIIVGSGELCESERRSILWQICILSVHIADYGTWRLVLAHTARVRHQHRRVVVHVQYVHFHLRRATIVC